MRPLEASHCLRIHEAADVVKDCADNMVQAYKTFRSIAIRRRWKCCDQFQSAAQLLFRFSISETMHRLLSGMYQIFERLLNVTAAPEVTGQFVIMVCQARTKACF